MRIILYIGAAVLFIMFYLQTIIKLGPNSVNSAIFVGACFVIIFILGTLNGRKKYSSHKKYRKL
jgi:hypothetical protein